MTEALEYITVSKSLTKIETFAEFVSIENEEILLNNFLDKINKFTTDLNRLTDLFLELDSILLTDFNKYTEAHKAILIEKLKEIRKKGIILYSTLSRTEMAKGMHTAIANYKRALDLVKEFICDLEVSKELKNDGDYNLIVDSFSK